MIEESDGRLAEAANHLRSELPLVERLSQDFSDRPEHQRELARTLMNLGNVLSAQNQPQDAEPILRRAIGVNATITAKNPEDMQIRLDLAKCHNNLGELLRKQGDTDEALASFLAARSINEALVKAFPDQPRYSDSSGEQPHQPGPLTRTSRPNQSRRNQPRRSRDLREAGR